MEIVALEQAAWKLEPARRSRECVSDGPLLAIDDTILIVDETVRIQH